MVDMGAPDTSGIDLDPGNFRCRADLVYCLRQLYVEIGRPSYRDLRKIGESMGIELAPATIGELIGEKSPTSTSQLTWKTVELFVLACGVPETELEGWRKAWRATVAPDRPAWQEERQHLLTEIDQLTTAFTAAEARTSQLTADLAAAEARIEGLTTADLVAAEERIEGLTDAVKEAESRALVAEAILLYRQEQPSGPDLPEQPSVPDLPELLKRLRIKAETYYDAKDYAGATNLYRQFATQVEHEYGSDHIRTLQAQHRHLEIETEALQESKLNPRLRVFTRCRLNLRWRHLIREYQRCLPEGVRAIPELRLEHIYWVALVLNRGRRSTALSHARKLLIGLHADCKVFLLSNDPFTAQVATLVELPDRLFDSRPKRTSPDSNSRKQQPRGVFQYGDRTA